MKASGAGDGRGAGSRGPGVAPRYIIPLPPSSLLLPLSTSLPPLSYVDPWPLYIAFVLKAFPRSGSSSTPTATSTSFFPFFLLFPLPIFPVETHGKLRSVRQRNKRVREMGEGRRVRGGRGNACHSFPTSDDVLQNPSPPHPSPTPHSGHLTEKNKEEQEIKKKWRGNGAEVK